MKPSPRQKLGPDRTAAASKAIGLTDGEFSVTWIVLDADPLGRGADVLDIVRGGKIIGRLIHQPGLYGEDGGDWHYRIATSIALKSHEIQGRARWPAGCWRYDGGPFFSPQAALGRFAEMIYAGERECPDAFPKKGVNPNGPDDGRAAIDD